MTSTQQAATRSAHVVHGPRARRTQPRSPTRRRVAAALLAAALAVSASACQAVLGLDDPTLERLLCDRDTEVEFEGVCYYLDGSGGECEPGYALAPQDVLDDIAELFVGKTYKNAQSDNCCIRHADEAADLQDWGMQADCNGPGPFTQTPALGGSDCTDRTGTSARQLTLCQSL